MCLAAYFQRSTLIIEFERSFATVHQMKHKAIQCIRLLIDPQNLS